jgi:hypothetical protein
MKYLSQIKKKLPLLLFVGILLLCLAFILINCGKGPQSKIINPDSGQYAVDCSQAPAGGGCVIYVVSNELLNRQGSEVTVEAWVKRKSENLDGAVFSRHNAKGVVMWVKDNEPKFAIRQLVSGTSTDFIFNSNFSLAENTWYHLAGVLVSADHSLDHSTCDVEGISTSIGLDASNKAYIGYHDAASGSVKYATNATGSWVKSTVASSGKFASLVVQTSNMAHLGYYKNGSNGDLFYAKPSSTPGTWLSPETVDNSVDVDGNSDGDLKDPVDIEIHVGKYNSIKLGSSNKAYISYYDVTNGDLKYATNASGSWVATAVDSTGDVGKYTSIALDSSNKAYISYFDVTNGVLKYATNASGSWVATAVDSTGDVGKYTSIALGSSNKAYISYFDVTNGVLKYATNASGSWVTTVVDSSGYVGQFTSIALDSSNKAYISYYKVVLLGDATTGNLMYATNASGSWVTTTVDSTGDVGRHTSIALDSSNKAYISYWDITNGNLKFASNASGSWGTETVDSDLENTRTEMPHMDFYINGVFANCGSTGERSMADLTCSPEKVGTGSCEGDTLGIGGFVSIDGVDHVVGSLNGVIDEVRYWTAARTKSELNECMGTELGLEDGNCYRKSDDLGAYLRLNEGKGAAPSDWTGLGAGSKEDASAQVDDPARFWNGGWVSGAPITRKD